MSREIQSEWKLNVSDQPSGILFYLVNPETKEAGMVAGVRGGWLGKVGALEGLGVNL